MDSGNTTLTTSYKKNESNYQLIHFIMNQQELHNPAIDEDARYGLAMIKWHGWMSPVGVGIFMLCLGGFIYLLHLSEIIG